MNKAATASRNRILQEGVALVSRDGLAGVSIGGLAQQVGMSKSGLFAHFRSKDEVQIALLDRSAEIATAHVVAPAMAAEDGLPRLEALVRNWLGWATRAGLPGGCPVAAALFELDDVAGPVRDKVAALEAEWQGLLTRLVGEAVARGHLRADLDADQFVWELFGIYLSHHAHARFLRRPDADARAAMAFASLVNRSRPADRPERRPRRPAR